MPTPKMSQMGIRIEDLEVPCVVGIYQGERCAPQPLRLTIEVTHEGHIGESDAAPFFDYAALSLAITFMCQSAHFLLLEDVATAVDDLVWAMLPASWHSRAMVSVDVKKPQALKHSGTPVVFARNDRPRLSALTHVAQGLRWARLAEWAQGRLYFIDGATQANISITHDDTACFVVSGDVLLSEAEKGLPIRKALTLHKLNVLRVQASTEPLGVLLYLPSLEKPQVVTENAHDLKPLKWKEGEDLFQRLGVPNNERVPFSELIWGEAPRRHPEAEPQNEWHDTDVAPAAPSPYPSKRAPNR